MTNKELWNYKDILKMAIIKKAVKGGWNFEEDKLLDNWVFSHDFAKAFWGDSKRRKEINIDPDDGRFYDDSGYEGVNFFGKEWEWHLMNMVLEENPLKYIEKFL